MTARAAIPEEIKQRARQLRRRALNGAKFRRQHPMAGFILDFYCAAAKPGIELDGDHHLSADASRQDAERTRILAEQDGVQSLRFQNIEVLRDAASVKTVIELALSKRLGGRSPDQESEWK